MTIFYSAALQRCVEGRVKAFLNRLPYEIEYRFKRAGESIYRWHRGLVPPYGDDSGFVVKWFGTMTDIDDQVCDKKLYTRLQ